MRALLARLSGMDRPRVIAIFGARRVEVERAVLHARAAGADVPLWAWCEEDAEPVEGCARFVSGAAANGFRRDLRGVWPALVIVAWTGQRDSVRFKLLPFLKPPFRVLVQNESGGFFQARSGVVGEHLARRVREALSGAVQQASEALRHAVRRIRHFFHCTVPHQARLLQGHVHDLRVRVSEIIRDTRAAVGWWLFHRRREFRERSGRISHFWSEFGLGILALLALTTPSMARAVVRGRAGRRHLTVAMPAAGISFVEILLRDRGWPRGEVMRALSEQEADYIVFRRAGESGEAQRLIELARENNAFAVAKQVAFSHWRQRVLTKHPFRGLLEGEVAQVFAPWSTLMVVRRDALLQLGCPHALTSGAALMLFFWRAAAAGLRSLVAGCGGEITDEPAMVLEDAEFAMRLALSTQLSSLGALYPSRQRGNVATMPALARKSTGKPRVLVVSPYLPWPLSHGGAVRIFNLCRALAGEVDFLLACFRENGETVHYDKLHEVFSEVYIVDADEKRVDPTVPTQVAEYRSSAMAELIRSFCLDKRVDLVQLEYTQMA